MWEGVWKGVGVESCCKKVACAFLVVRGYAEPTKPGKSKVSRSITAKFTHSTYASLHSRVLFSLC